MAMALRNRYLLLALRSAMSLSIGGPLAAADILLDWPCRVWHQRVPVAHVLGWIRAVSIEVEMRHDHGARPCEKAGSGKSRRWPSGVKSKSTASPRASRRGLEAPLLRQSASETHISRRCSVLSMRTNRGAAGSIRGQVAMASAMADLSSGIQIGVFPPPSSLEVTLFIQVFW